MKQPTEPLSGPTTTGPRTFTVPPKANGSPATADCDVDWDAVHEKVQSMFAAITNELSTSIQGLRSFPSGLSSPSFPLSSGVAYALESAPEKSDVDVALDFDLHGGDVRIRGDIVVDDIGLILYRTEPAVVAPSTDQVSAVAARLAQDLVDRISVVKDALLRPKADEPNPYETKQEKA